MHSYLRHTNAAKGKMFVCQGCGLEKSDRAALGGSCAKLDHVFVVEDSDGTVYCSKCCYVVGEDTERYCDAVSNQKRPAEEQPLLLSPVVYQSSVRDTAQSSFKSSQLEETPMVLFRGVRSGTYGADNSRKQRASTAVSTSVPPAVPAAPAATSATVLVVTLDQMNWSPLSFPYLSVPFDLTKKESGKLEALGCVQRQVTISSVMPILVDKVHYFFGTKVHVKKGAPYLYPLLDDKGNVAL